MNNNDEILQCLIKAKNPHWVHNAAITQDIEALRRICLYFSEWWNDEAYPTITKLCGDEDTAIALLSSTRNNSKI